jgi:hypothetical protein
VHNNVEIEIRCVETAFSNKFNSFLHSGDWINAESTISLAFRVSGLMIFHGEVSYWLAPEQVQFLNQFGSSDVITLGHNSGQF